MSLNLEIETWPTSRIENAKNFILDFELSPKGRRFVFGINMYSEAIVKHFDIQAFVDDRNVGAKVGGIPVIGHQAIPKDALVIVASGGNTQSALRRIHDTSGARALDYFGFHKWSNLPLPEARFNELFSQKFSENEDKAAWLLSQMADEESLQTLQKIFAFRSSYDIEALAGFVENQKNQYFENFLEIGNKPLSFLDVGGFDGETTSDFLKIANEGSKSVILEPEPQNYEICKDKFINNPAVTVICVGAGSEEKLVRFNANGSESVISEEGNLEIKIIEIDKLQQGPFDLIKMDIEGQELEAISGAKQTISKYSPKLAICVYHKPEHFWEIPLAILSINQKYRIFLRNYTETIYETVMYFVPQKAGDTSDG